jgi:hypothetical protein
MTLLSKLRDAVPRIPSELWWIVIYYALQYPFEPAPTWIGDFDFTLQFDHKSLAVRAYEVERTLPNSVRVGDLVSISVVLFRYLYCVTSSNPVRLSSLTPMELGEIYYRLGNLGNITKAIPTNVAINIDLAFDHGLGQKIDDEIRAMIHTTPGCHISYTKPTVQPKRLSFMLWWIATHSGTFASWNISARLKSDQLPPEAVILRGLIGNHTVKLELETYNNCLVLNIS